MLGITLVEWVVVLAISAIVTTIAAPGLVGFLQRAGVASATSALARSIVQARQIAQQQGKTVTVILNRTVAQACGTSSSSSVAVAWLTTVAGNTAEPLECVSSTDLQSRYGVTMSVAATTVRYNATGLADNTATVDVTFTRGAYSGVVRIHPGGLARVQ